MAIQQEIQRINIRSDSQLVINSSNGKPYIPKEISNLVKNVGILSSFLRELNLSILIGKLIRMLIT